VTGRASTGNAGREVEVRAPAGRVFRFRITEDDTAVLLIDGHPAVGIDIDGAGHWRDGEVWERLGGGSVTERYVVVRDMTAEQFHGLAPHLHLPPTWFGRFKGGPDEPRDISLDSGEWSCGSDAALDLAIAYLRQCGLAYDETRTVRHQPPYGDQTGHRPDPEGGPEPAETDRS